MLHTHWQEAPFRRTTLQILREEAKDLRRYRTEVAMPPGAVDPLDPVLRAVNSIEALDLFIALACALERKHVFRRRNDRVRLRSHLLHPIRKIQTLLDEVRNALLRLLNTGPRRKKLVEGSDIAGDAGNL